MAKVNGPLMSLGASGTLGNMLTYGGETGHGRVRLKNTNPRQLTEAQDLNAGRFQAAGLSWVMLPAETKEEWREKAKGKPQNGYNLYIADYLKNLPRTQSGTVEITGDCEVGAAYSWMPNFKFTPAADVMAGNAYGYTYRAMIRFDLAEAGVPEGADIVSATLGVKVVYVRNQPVAWRVVLGGGKEWVMSEVTWNNWKDGSAWDTPGGDFSETPGRYVNVDTGALSKEFQEIDITAIADTGYKERNGILDLFCKRNPENSGVNNFVDIYATNRQPEEWPYLVVGWEKEV